MSSRTCDYVASKSNPESWHVGGSSKFYLDFSPEIGGLGITEWHCPHPPLDSKDSIADGDNQYCVFHTDPADVPDDTDEREILLDALKEAGNGPQADRPEHRGQFVGATFGAIDLSDETIAATEHHDVRFDHAVFQTDDGNLNFKGTTFVTEGEHPISFVGTKFIANEAGDVQFPYATFRSNGAGDVRFHGATFRTDSEGEVSFTEATFRSNGAGDVQFLDATFRSNGAGDVTFPGATFRTDSEGEVDFEEATFRSNGTGDVRFPDATFRTDNEGSVKFPGATFQTNGRGSVRFLTATFRAEGEGEVDFHAATFRTDGVGGVWFIGATFRTDGKGDVWFFKATFRTDGVGDVEFFEATFQTDGAGSVTFQDAVLVNVNFQDVEFTETDFRSVDLTGTDFREANVSGISVNGETACKRLKEGYGDSGSTGRLSIRERLRRLYRGSEFDSEEWDATARAYHQLKTVFSEHGLVGRARNMHVRERRARNLESKAANGWFDHRYLRSLPSRVFTGYGVQVWYLVSWMVALFLFSTAVYIGAGVQDTYVQNISYSVLAFTVAPPRIPTGIGTQFVMMIETFFGTLSIVLLGYILGNRERF